MMLLRRLLCFILLITTSMATEAPTEAAPPQETG